METITISLRVISIALVIIAGITVIVNRKWPEADTWLLTAIWFLLLI